MVKRLRAVCGFFLLLALLLDDVLSELDEKRQDFVLNQIKSGQVFITCCEPGRFTKLGKTMEISNGQLVEG